jgi:sensor domain CHASE-containing protein
MAKKGSKQRQHYRRSKKGKVFRAGSVKYQTSKPFSKIPSYFDHLQIETAVYVPDTIYRNVSKKTTDFNRWMNCEKINRV